MDKIRVHELVKELKKSNREVTDRLKKLGIPYKSVLSSITQEDANRVRESFGQEPVKIEKKPAAKKAAKKPAAKKAAKKPEKKAAAKKAAKKPAAKKAGKPAAKKTTAEKVVKKAAAPRVVKKKPDAKTKAKAVTTEIRETAALDVLETETPLLEKPIERPSHDVEQIREVVEAETPAAKEDVMPALGEVSHEPGFVPEDKEAEKVEAEKEPEGSAGKESIPASALEEKIKVGEAPFKKAKAEPEKESEKPKVRVAAVKPRKLPQKEPGKVIRFPVDRRKQPSKHGKNAVGVVLPKVLRVPSGITVREFAQKVGLSPADVIKKLMSLGEVATINQPLSDDALVLLGEDIGIEVKVKAQRVDEIQKELERVDRPEDLQPRPPVVTVMGHVDHGKTLLLDAIRKTDVVSREAGGITQHIGAYQVTFEGRKITFIDTPGHESFTAMRARGAQVTDIAVLVVAADDGVMPQTIEAIDHAKQAEVPIIVAVNKIDKPDADPIRVRQQLSEKGLIPEEWGGDTIFVDISAKEGTNIDHLLEMILLLADISELKANPDAEASGVVIEARLDRARGPLATVLIKRGTAKIGDAVVCGSVWGKIRAMFNERGEKLKSAGPSTPVEVIGLSGLPMAGDKFFVVSDEKKAKQLAEHRSVQKRLSEQAKTQKVSFENLLERLREEEIAELKIILKADTQGSLEAILDSLKKMQSEEIRLSVIHSGIGGITETDVMLASASNATIIGFNVRPDGKAMRSAEIEGIEIRTYQVIYELLDDIKKALEGMLAPEQVEQVEGRAEVRQTFRIPGVGIVAGCYVLEGEISRGSQVRLLRDGIVVHAGKIASVRRFKEDVRSVASGYECGVALENFQDIKEGDILETFVLKEVPR